jgi:hypothetical protein
VSDENYDEQRLSEDCLCITRVSWDGALIVIADSECDRHRLPPVTAHTSATPITHTGPGHRFADPDWCEGCWWQLVGRFEPPRNRNQHAPDCPGCQQGDTMPKYRKKPVVIDAQQLTDDNGGAVAQWCGGTLRGGPKGGSKGGHVLIHTLEGTMTAEPGDYVIRGVQGEFYPCKPDIFEQTYEPA